MRRNSRASDSKPKRVILAVDIKADEPKQILSIWSALQPALKNQSVIIEPVTVLNREDAAMANYFRSRIGNLKEATERYLDDQLRRLGIKGLAPASALFADGSSTHQSVKALLGYARRVGCDLIAVGSHSRKGAARFFMGSFAETLSLQSLIPLLVANPRQKTATGLTRILYPTDLSPESRKGLDLVSRSFQHPKPKFVLFHRFMHPMPLAVDPLLAIPQELVDEEFEKQKKKGDAWCKALNSRGIDCKFVIDKKSPDVTAAILAAMTREKAGLVAMTSTGSKWETKILGSITRQVLRNSPKPVWVVRA